VNVKSVDLRINPESLSFYLKSAEDGATYDRDDMTRCYVISRFTFVSWRDGSVQITSPIAGKTFTISDSSFLNVLSAFATARTIEEVLRNFPAAEKNIQEWIEAAILVDPESPEIAAVHHWDPASLALHVSSRDNAWRKTPGHATSAVAPRRSDDSIPLAQGGAAAPHIGGSDLTALLDARRSRRDWANLPISFSIFSDLLWLSARNRDHSRFKGAVSRPYPSGGAAYSLELYPILAQNAVETLDAGVYRYLPQWHALEVVSPFEADFHPFLVAAGRAMGTTPPPVSVIITSRYARQSEEYSCHAYSLVLKEVGCLYQTLYLVAGSLGLAACALGGGTPHGLLADLCSTTDLEEPVVGEFAIGAAADPA
jgi:SagB-type dehydrogenase family enzyme